MKRIWAVFLWAPLLVAQAVPNLYIVELTGDPVARVAARKGERLAAVDRRAQVLAEQDQARAAFAESGAQVLDALDTVANALIVRAPEAAAGKLASLPGVKRVYPDRVVHLLLDHALPLQKVPEAWRLAGGMDSAGAGIKIAIVDTGIDDKHAGFQDPSLKVPDGFPKVNKDSDIAFTNNKIIVGRTYENLLGAADGGTPADERGHGTAVAMAAAGVTNTGLLGTITGAAPKAFLGNYKVFHDATGATRGSVIMKAIDDAVKDGMDIINLSVGSPLAARTGDSLEVEIIDNAAAAGVIVVTAAGNEGPDPNTISDYATAASAIAVGASANDRTFASAVLAAGMPAFLAVPGSASTTTASVTAPLLDVARLDTNGLACGALPADSLRDHVALILRGTCTFEAKFNNAQQAGAVGAVLYTSEDKPDANFIMVAGSATLPAVLVSYADGITLKNQLAKTPELQATLQFIPGPTPHDPNRLASFSSRGPSADAGIKPDVLAVGQTVYTATQKSNPDGDIYDATGYTIISGTSFSSPLVAGAAAVLKAARPGLDVKQYRSLLVNSATPFVVTGATLPAAQQAGAGLLNLENSLRNTVTVFPASLSFGSGGGTMDLSRELKISNLGAAADTFTISAEPAGDGPVPDFSTNALSLDAGASNLVTVRLAGTSLKPGQYQGFLRLRGANSAVDTRVPYWYAVPSGVPAFLTILQAEEKGDAGATVRQAAYFRVTDASGLPISNIEPSVTVTAGDGSVGAVRSIDSDVPGAFYFNAILGPLAGANKFQIEVPGLPAKTVVITGKKPASTP